ncbi:hypothetical protein KBB89_00025 [Candidatus Gracilibacteria bacterium]|nr:hypothetical protein [Candidatus Gracilibacteria bacterium]
MKKITLASVLLVGALTLSSCSLFPADKDDVMVKDDTAMEKTDDVMVKDDDSMMKDDSKTAEEVNDAMKQVDATVEADAMMKQ